MTDQFSGEMIRGLSDAVDRLVPFPNTGSNTVSKESLEQLRAVLLSSDTERDLPSGFREAWLQLIDLYLSENPDPAKITATFQKLQKLEPSLPGNAKAIGIDALRAGLR